MEPTPTTAPRARGRSATSTAADGRVAMSSEETALSMTVERRRTEAGDFLLAGGFAFDGWELRLTALPARYPDHVGVALRAPRGRGVTWSRCPIRVMADGVMLADPAEDEVELVGGEVAGYVETIHVIVPRTELAMMATAERLAVRVCDTELRLGPEHRAVIAELLLRLEEELRWLTVDSTPTAPVQDLTAVPADAGAAPEDAP